MRLLIVFCAVLMVDCANRVRYDGYKVYRLQVHTEEQLKILHEFHNILLVDFWSLSKIRAKPIDVMIKPDSQDIFERLLGILHISFKILIDDVETVVERERSLQSKIKVKNGTITFQRYNRYNEINNYLSQLEKIYPGKVTVQRIGTSHERRSLNVIKISTNPSARKPVIFIDAGKHGREWISTAMAMYIINQLVENENNRDLIENVDWHILPLVNPDGYEYSHEIARLWRKTRSPQTACMGVDGNRNFDFHWGEVGTSSDPCSNVFKGPIPFSERETASVEQYILERSDKIKLYLSLHSYGNFLLYPWAYTSGLPKDVVELRELADYVNAAIVKAGGDSYTVGSFFNALYAASGTSEDWVKSFAKINLSYAIKLPGGGSFGFDPAPSDIIATVTQTFSGIEAYGKFVAKQFSQKN